MPLISWYSSLSGYWADKSGEFAIFAFKLSSYYVSPYCLFLRSFIFYCAILNSYCYSDNSYSFCPRTVRQLSTYVSFCKTACFKASKFWLFKRTDCCFSSNSLEAFRISASFCLTWRRVVERRDAVSVRWSLSYLALFFSSTIWSYVINKASKSRACPVFF